MSNSRFTVYGFSHHRDRNPWEHAPPWAIELRSILGFLTSEMRQNMSQLDDELATLKNDVAATRGAADSAVTLINGFQAKLDAAVQAALDKGASKDQLQALTDLSAGVNAIKDELGAAVAAAPSA